MPTLWVIGYAYVFWLLYVLIMGFYRAWLAGRLTLTAKILALPAIVVGYLVDLFANWTIAVVWFREWPSRPLELVTDRLSRYIALPPTFWRCIHARWLCETLLDYFDPNGKHCIELT